MNGFESLIQSSKKLWPSKLIKKGAVNTKLVLLGVVGILLLLLGGAFDAQTDKKTETPGEIGKAIPIPSVSRSYEEALEVKLSNLLSQVRGAGSVAVSVTLETSVTYDHAKNLVKETKMIQEKDPAGGVRTTTETKENQQILLGKENGADKPVMVREIKPPIK